MTLSKSNNDEQQIDFEPQLFGDNGEVNLAQEDRTQESHSSEVYQISLLEEKLQVARSKRKLGEVVIRKQVETRIVKIPIRREKLIIERVGENPEQLAEVVIGEEKVNGFKYEELNDTDNLHVTKSNFIELKTAQDLMETISHFSSIGNTKVRLEIVTNCSEDQIEYQNICDRFN